MSSLHPLRMKRNNLRQFFSKPDMGVCVAQDFPEAYVAETNILGVAEADYPRTRWDQRAKAYDKWVKWRGNMENASNQAYAILRLAVENSLLEVIKTTDGYEEANNNRDAIAFLNVLNQTIYVVRFLIAQCTELKRALNQELKM